jgi:hypothetical protein
MRFRHLLGGLALVAALALPGLARAQCASDTAYQPVYFAQAQGETVAPPARAPGTTPVLTQQPQTPQQPTAALQPGQPGAMAPPAGTPTLSAVPAGWPAPTLAAGACCPQQPATIAWGNACCQQPATFVQTRYVAYGGDQCCDAGGGRRGHRRR